jgi:hypothetical protein
MKEGPDRLTTPYKSYQVHDHCMLQQPQQAKQLLSIPQHAPLKTEPARRKHVLTLTTDQETYLPGNVLASNAKVLFPLCSNPDTTNPQAGLSGI